MPRKKQEKTAPPNAKLVGCERCGRYPPSRVEIHGKVGLCFAAILCSKCKRDYADRGCIVREFEGETKPQKMAGQPA